jgi:hypothetical protein
MKLLYCTLLPYNHHSDIVAVFDVNHHLAWKRVMKDAVQKQQTKKTVSCKT